jgi:hypothetical protein
MPSEIVVLSFDGAGTAGGVPDNLHLRDMERRGLLRLDDAVVASRPPRDADARGPAADDPPGSLFLQDAARAIRGASGARGAPVQIEPTDSRRGRAASSAPRSPRTARGSRRRIRVQPGYVRSCA